ncbi:DNA glycosylase AlkZ-like family protein [Leifsonia sp. 2MCAF36]|uniref:DNA glycosylase AlkZ-like family protein n=1 Tax=Leifsonia sp. 2MCAF36 TaxID=3232988 RepID=UPI003F9E77E4
MTVHSVSRQEARTIAVHAQALRGADGLTTSEALDQLGCVQIDAIRAVRRSHELAFLSRGHDPGDGFGPSHVNGFETWGHAHSVIALKYWPLLESRRRAIREHGLTGPQVDTEVCERVLATIRNEGPKTLTELENARGTGWERSSPSRAACEWLLSVGDLVVSDRNEKWQRVYSLAREAIPAPLLRDELSDEDCRRGLVDVSLRALGIATSRHIADYFRIHHPSVQRLLRGSDALTATVDGSDEVWYLHSETMPATLDDDSITPLSPLDSLVWTRQRQRELFDRDYLLESYKPAAKRQFGYFGMPMLQNYRIVGRVAARRAGSALTVEALQSDVPLSTESMDDLCHLLMSWTACEAVDTTTTKWMVDDLP